MRKVYLVLFNRITLLFVTNQYCRFVYNKMCFNILHTFLVTLSLFINIWFTIIMLFLFLKYSEPVNESSYIFRQTKYKISLTQMTPQKAEEL